MKLQNSIGQRLIPLRNLMVFREIHKNPQEVLSLAETQQTLAYSSVHWVQFLPRP